MLFTPSMAEFLVEFEPVVQSSTQVFHVGNGRKSLEDLSPCILNHNITSLKFFEKCMPQFEAVPLTTGQLLAPLVEVWAKELNDDIPELIRKLPSIERAPAPSEHILRHDDFM